MSRDDAVLLDMLIAAQRSVEFSSGATRDQLGSDLKTQSAILHQLLVLGEAAKRLSEAFRDAFGQPVEGDCRDAGPHHSRAAHTYRFCVRRIFRGGGVPDDRMNRRSHRPYRRIRTTRLTVRTST